MSVPRFYAPDLEPSSADVILSADESHHLVRVLRLGRGSEVRVFDGRGHEFTARVDSTDRQSARLSLLAPVTSVPLPGITMVLVQAVLKGDKMDGIVRDATMAGVARFVPIVTDRSLMGFQLLRRSSARERWQRIAVSSAKQCGQSRLPRIDSPIALDAWLAEPFHGNRLLLVEPSANGGRARSMRAVLEDVGPKADTIACIVGPEGGWPPAEVEAAVAAGCTPVTLGHMTLRADAVGLVAVSIVNFAAGANESAPPPSTPQP